MQESVAILCFKMAKKLSHASKNLLCIFLQLSSTKAENIFLTSWLKTTPMLVHFFSFDEEIMFFY